MSVQDTERLIQEFAENTLTDLKSQSDASRWRCQNKYWKSRNFCT